MQEQVGSGVGLVAVGFAPARPLAELADHLRWDAPFLSDPDRVVYRALGLGRAPLYRVYSPGTVALYVRARLRGVRLQRPVDDPRQLGGDAILRDGIVIRRWRPRSPDDRVDPALLVRTAVALL